MKSLLYFGRRRAARKAAAVRFLKEELSEGKFEEKRNLGKVATVPLSRLLLLLLLFNRVQICPLNLKETTSPSSRWKIPSVADQLSTLWEISLF